MPRLPNPWTPLAGLLPGLDVIRAPAALFAGVHLVACILAGAGAAVLLGAVPRRWMAWAATLLIGMTFFGVLRPRSLGMEPTVVYQPVELRPREETLEFFERLAAVGNRGPIFEVVLDERPIIRKTHASRSLLLTTYHHRRTSTCFNSFQGDFAQEIDALGQQLHEVSTLRRLRELGFTTIVVRESSAQRGAPGRANALLQRLESTPGLPLREILRHGGLRAYALEPLDGRTDEGPGDRAAMGSRGEADGTIRSEADGMIHGEADETIRGAPGAT